MSSDVKWIKITTDIFDDEKILLIESLPESDAIIVIWFKLLCLAGKQNNKGVFMLNERIAYTEDMLATIFRRKTATVKMALEVFKRFGMIETVDGVITIPNWGKHQNMDKIEAKTEYMKGYMKNYREKQKALVCKTNSKANSKTNSKTNSKANVSEADIDKDKEIELDIEKEIEVDINTPSISPSKRGGDKKAGAQKKEPVVYYPNDELLDSAFKEFLTMRNKIKKPIATKNALTRIMNKIDKLSGGDNDLAVKILNQSTDHCWQDVYLLKDEQDKGRSVFDEWRNA